MKNALTVAAALSAPTTCCERDCASKGHVCVSADATPEAMTAAPAAPAASSAPAPSSSALDTAETVLGAIADNGPAAASVTRARAEPVGRHRDWRRHRARARVPRRRREGRQGSEAAQFDAAEVMHQVADQLAAHHAAAEAIRAQRFPEAK